MTMDLTGAGLLTFLIREIRYIAAQHPRFKDNNGEALVAYSNLISFSDVKIQVSNLSSSGTRLSPDNFFATQMGRMTVAKIETKPGHFIEWAREMDPNNVLPEPGIYYYNVDAVDEKEQTVSFTSQAYKWYQGEKEFAEGSFISVSPDIDTAGIVFSDPSVKFVPMLAKIQLLTYVAPDTTLSLGSRVLVPGEDYWVSCERTKVIATTRGGTEFIPYPKGFERLDLFIDDRCLRQGSDYWIQSNGIRLGDLTPVGREVLARGPFREDPAVEGFVNPENKLDFAVDVNHELVKDQTVYYLNRVFHDASDLVITSDSVWLRVLATPGTKIEWEARVAGPLDTVQATKMMTSRNILPGAEIAIGDRVVVGDQCAIVVAPETCETYEIYGSKENVSFELEVSTNDVITTSELAELLRTYFAVTGRDRLESAGITVFEVTKSYRGEQKDASGTSARHMATVSIQAAADWEFYKPLVTRMDWGDLEVDTNSSLPGNPSVQGRYRQFGAFVFVPSYS
jgi:hypothetical protein